MHTFLSHIGHEADLLLISILSIFPTIRIVLNHQVFNRSRRDSQHHIPSQSTTPLFTIHQHSIFPSPERNTHRYSSYPDHHCTQDRPRVDPYQLNPFPPQQSFTAGRGGTPLCVLTFSLAIFAVIYFLIFQ